MLCYCSADTRLVQNQTERFHKHSHFSQTGILWKNRGPTQQIVLKIKKIFLSSPDKTSVTLSY